jgi:hypothetical protein
MIKKLNNSSKSDVKTEERNFIKKSAWTTLVFLFISAIGLMVVKYLDLVLDAQTAGNFFIFAFASGVAYAGALIVINISAQQNELSERQLRLESKSTPEHAYAIKVSQEFMEGIASIFLSSEQLVTNYSVIVDYDVNGPEHRYYEFFIQANKLVPRRVDIIREELVKPWLGCLGQYPFYTKEEAGMLINCVTTLDRMCLLAQEALKDEQKNKNIDKILIKILDVVECIEELFDRIKHLFEDYKNRKLSGDASTLIKIDSENQMELVFHYMALAFDSTRNIPGSAASLKKVKE